MSAGVLAQAAHWLAAPLLAAALAAGLGVIMARSLFAMCMCLAAAGASAAAAAALLGAGEGALALALVAAAWAPLLLLAAMLLSARAAKPRRRGRPYLSIVAAAVSAGAILWAAPELEAPARSVHGAAASLGVWPAMLLFVAGAACVGLLGYGERGVLQNGLPENQP